MTDSPIQTKAAPDPRVLNRSVQSTPTVNQNFEPSGGVLTMQLASVADEVVPWGKSPARRDRQLREFWPTENILASTIYATAIRNAAFSWKLDGPPRTVAAVQNMLHSANLGKGWLYFMVRCTIDLLTQDNAAFVELIRAEDAETSPVIGISHLDAERCRRTGDPLVPVIYRDRLGALHKMKWYQVISLEEMPSPIETMNGMQYCFVTRVLRAAQIMRDIKLFKREKIGARGPTAIHLVGGVTQARITDATAKADEKGDNQGLLKWLTPYVIASLDPTVAVTHVEIPLKSLPDGFDEDVAMRWYINDLALGSGNDYQDLAPLPGGGLGTSNQSEILHRKSRGKGPGFFMKLVEQAFTFHGVIPQSVKMTYDEQDVAADKEKADLALVQAQTFQIFTAGLHMPYQVVWQMMADKGVISQDNLDMLGQHDVTPDVTADDDVPYEEADDVPAIPGTTAPAPAAAPIDKPVSPTPGTAPVSNQKPPGKTPAAAQPAKPPQKAPPADAPKSESQPAPAQDGAPPADEPKPVEFNGAQVTAALGVLANVATGDITYDQGLNVLQIMFGVTEAQARQLLGNEADAGKSPPATPAATKDAPPPTEDWSVVEADYRNRLAEALMGYAGGDRVTAHKNAFRQALAEDVPGAFYSGYVEAGGEDTEPDDEKELTRLINAQLEFVDGVFDWVKEQRDAETISEPAINARVDTWVAGLSGIYAEGKARGDANQMLTFKGDDGAESCKDCQKWKGKRHSAGFWRKKGLLARNGNPNFECGRWDTCAHDYFTDAGVLWSR